MDKLKSLPEFRDVASDQLNHGLLATLTIDRDTASRLGILPADIDNTLYDAFGQRQVSTIFTQLNQYHVVLGSCIPTSSKIPTRSRISTSSLCSAAGFSGSAANISTLAAGHHSAPILRFPSALHVPGRALAINHQGQFPVVTISFNLAPGASLGDAINAIEQARKDN